MMNNLYAVDVCLFLAPKHHSLVIIDLTNDWLCCAGNYFSLLKSTHLKGSKSDRILLFSHLCCGTLSDAVPEGEKLVLFLSLIEVTAQGRLLNEAEEIHCLAE